MKKLIMIMVAIVVVVVVLPLWRSSLEQQQEGFPGGSVCEPQQPCPYLGDVPQLKEWKVEGNSLYLSFDPLPRCWETFTIAAAGNFWNRRNVRTYTWAIRGCDLNNGRLNRDWRTYGYHTVGNGENKWTYADGKSYGPREWPALFEKQQERILNSNSFYQLEQQP